MKYRIKDCFMLKDIAGDKIVVAKGENALEFNGILVLNDSCIFLWDKMKAFVDCPYSSRCITCVAAHYNDTGEFNKVSPRLCWKIQHPEEAAEIMKRLEQEGLIKKDEQQ